MAQKITLEGPSQEVVRWIAEELALVDLQVTTSFDLQIARATHTECSCPYHGTAACDCQMVVLLVYGRDAYPATLVVHGRDGRTYLSLADTPGQRPSTKLAATIFTALSPEAFSYREQAQDTLKVS